MGAVLLLATLTGAFFWYVSDYYPAQDVALEVMARGDGMAVEDGMTILSPSVPTDTAIIFYPGAKVESAYLPLLDQSAAPASPASWWRCPSAWRF